MHRIDAQRFHVYLAENRSGVRGAQFRSLFQVQTYVDRVIFSDWWTERFPECPSIVVRQERSDDTCGSSGPLGGGLLGSFIVLPPAARFERYVLHELAHCAANHPPEAHGPEFARAYVDLVEAFMSREAAIKLARSFRRSGVAIAPRTREGGLAWRPRWMTN